MNPLQLEAYISQLLQVPQLIDYAPNGLQIEGCSDIQTITTAVTASLNVIQKSIELKADALLVHHGYFWKGEADVICGLKKARIETILNHQLNLFAYHLPLDIYPLWGNNACMGQRFNASIVHKLAWKNHPDLLWIGNLEQPTDPKLFLQQLQTIYGPQVQGIVNHSFLMRRIAWCSGGADDLFELAIAQGVDAFISGEASERCYHLAKESNVHFFAAGHHATEKDGIRSLGHHLANEFDLKHFFIDEDNPF